MPINPRVKSGLCIVANRPNMMQRCPSPHPHFPLQPLLLTNSSPTGFLVSILLTKDAYPHLGAFALFASPFWNSVLPYCHRLDPSLPFRSQLICHILSEAFSAPLRVASHPLPFKSPFSYHPILQTP